MIAVINLSLVLASSPFLSTFSLAPTILFLTPAPIPNPPDTLVSLNSFPLSSLHFSIALFSSTIPSSFLYLSKIEAYSYGDILSNSLFNILFFVLSSIDLNLAYFDAWFIPLPTAL